MERRKGRRPFGLRLLAILLTFAMIISSPNVDSFLSAFGFFSVVKAESNVVELDYAENTEVFGKLYNLKLALENKVKEAATEEDGAGSWLNNYDFEIRLVEFNEIRNNNGNYHMIYNVYKQPVIVINKVKDNLPDSIKNLTVKPSISFGTVSVDSSLNTGGYITASSFNSLSIELAPMKNGVSPFKNAPASVFSYTFENGVLFPSDMSNFFFNSKACYIDLSGVQFSNVSNMYSMFYGCRNLRVVNMSNIVVPSGNNVDISSMFRECRNIEYINWSGADLRGITKMNLLFQETDKLRRIKTPAHFPNASDTQLSGGSSDGNIIFLEAQSEDSDGATAYSTVENNGELSFVEPLKETKEADLLGGKYFIFFSSSMKANTDYFRGKEIIFTGKQYDFDSTTKENKQTSTVTTPTFLRAYAIKYDRDFKVDEYVDTAYFDNFHILYAKKVDELKYNYPFLSEDTPVSLPEIGTMVSPGDTGYVPMSFIPYTDTNVEAVSKEAKFNKNPKDNTTIYNGLVETEGNVETGNGSYIVKSSTKKTINRNILIVDSKWDVKRYNIVYHYDATDTKTPVYHQMADNAYSTPFWTVGESPNDANVILYGNKEIETDNGKLHSMTKIGYHLNGWYDNTSLTGTIYDSERGDSETGVDQYYTYDNSDFGNSSSNIYNKLLRYDQNLALADQSWEDAKDYARTVDGLKKENDQSYLQLNLYANWVKNDYKLRIHEGNSTQDNQGDYEVMADTYQIGDTVPSNTIKGYADDVKAEKLQDVKGWLINSFSFEGSASDLVKDHNDYVYIDRNDALVLDERVLAGSTKDYHNREYTHIIDLYPVYDDSVTVELLCEPEENGPELSIDDEGIAAYNALGAANTDSNKHYFTITKEGGKLTANIKTDVIYEIPLNIFSSSSAKQGSAWTLKYYTNAGVDTGGAQNEGLILSTEDVNRIVIPRDSDVKYKKPAFVVSTANESYTINYYRNSDANDTTLVKTVTSAKIGDLFLESDNNLSNESYLFNGWNTVRNGSGTAYEGGARIPDLGNDGATINLYAQWDTSYTIRLKTKFDYKDHYPNTGSDTKTILEKQWTWEGEESHSWIGPKNNVATTLPNIDNFYSGGSVVNGRYTYSDYGWESDLQFGGWSVGKELTIDDYKNGARKAVGEYTSNPNNADVVSIDNEGAASDDYKDKAVSGIVSFYPIWAPVSNIVVKDCRYDSGATATTTPVEFADANSSITSSLPTSFSFLDADITLGTPSRPGYTFRGYKIKNGDNYVSIGTIETANTAYYSYHQYDQRYLGKDIVLYAMWEPTKVAYNVELNFVKTDGTLDTATTIPIAVGTATYNQYVTGQSVDITNVLTTLKGLIAWTNAISTKQTSNSCTYDYCDNTTIINDAIAGDTEYEPVTTATMKSDGSTTFKVYYLPKYTITYQPGAHAAAGAQDVVENKFLNETYVVSKVFDAATGYHRAATDFTVALPNENRVTATADAIYTARWTPNTYNVSFDKNAEDAIGTMVNQQFTYGNQQQLTENGFSRTGYTFAGWNINPSGNEYSNYNDQQEVTNLTTANDGLVVLYARWTPITYNVIYHSNYGSDVPYDPDGTISYGADFDLEASNRFSREGYTLTNWNTAQNGQGINYDPGTTVSNLSTTQGATVDLYAVWSPIQYTLTLYNDSENQVSKNVTYNEVVTPITSLPTKDGYIFGGYYTEESGGGTQVINANGSPIASATNYTDSDSKWIKASNTDLFAKWTGISYTVHFNRNAENATGDISDQAFTYGDPQNLSTNGFNREGYTFAGWAISSEGDVEYTNNQSVNNLTTTNDGTVNLFAVWTPNGYTVNFHANGGEGSMNSQSFVYEISQNLTTNAFTKTGYTFAGWATSAEGNVEYTNNQSVSNLSSTSEGVIDLFAKWNANTYTVKFHGNDPTSGSMEDQSFTYDVPQNLTNNGFSKTGYTFAGWTTSDLEDAPVVYTNEDSVINLTSSASGEINLYAKWDPATDTEYTVKYYYQNALTGEYPADANDSDTETGTTLTTARVTDDDKIPNVTYTGGNTYIFDELNSNNVLSASINADGSTVLKVYFKLQYTITYEPGDHAAAGETSSSETVDWGALTPSHSFTAATGYTRLDTDFASTQYGTTVKEDRTYTAVWTPINYTISYSLNDGSFGESSNPVSYNIESDNITLINPTKAGYTFAGWTGTGLDDATTSVTIATGSTGDRSYTATWTAIDYSVTLDGGEGAVFPDTFNFGELTTSPTYTKNGATATITYTVETSNFALLPTPTKIGSQFVGWYTNLEDENTRFIQLNTNTKTNYTYHAKWETAKTVITFNKNADDATGTMSSQTINYNTSAALTANAFTRTTYDFAGWNTVPTPTTETPGTSYADGASFANNVPSHRDLTLYAQWTPKTYTVTFNRGVGAVGGSETATATYGSNSYIYAGNEGSFVAPTMTGYTFGGYRDGQDTETKYINPDGTGAKAWDKSEDTTLFAMWTANGYEVRFHGNGSTSGSMTDQSFTYNEAQTLTANAFEKTGYTFIGWATSESGNVVHTDQEQVSNLSAVSGATVDLYAKWAPITYKVVFDKNFTDASETEAAIPMADQEITYDTVATLTENAFVRTGYTFAGWNTLTSPNDNEQGVAYTDKHSVQNLVSTNNGSIILYAQWTPNTNTSYKVEYYYQKETDGTFEKKNEVSRTGTTASECAVTEYDKLPVSTYTGTSDYAFDSNNESKILSGTIDRTGATVLKVYFKLQYTITYAPGSHAAQSAVSDSTTKVDWDYKLTPSHSFAAATGYHRAVTEFVTNEYTEGVKENRTYTAAWTANSYSIVFDRNKGTGSSNVVGTMDNESMTYDLAANLTENVYTRDGYTFTGWNTKADGIGIPYSDKAEVINLVDTNNGSITLYAQWDKISYTVTLDGNAATTEGTASTTVYFDDKIAQIESLPSKTGYTFNGYTTDGTNTGTKYIDNTGAGIKAWDRTANATLKAVWIPNTYTVKYDKNTEDTVTGTMADQTGFTYDAATTLTKNTFARTGYTFTGWNTEASGTGDTLADEASVQNLVSENGSSVTLYAIWRPHTFTVKFDKNTAAGTSEVTGTMADASFTFNYKDPANILPENKYARAGYGFAGWTYNNNTYADKANVENLTAVDEAEITFTAKWTAKNYTLTLDDNNGTGGSGTLNVTYDAALSDVTAPSRTGYTFNGYFLGDTKIVNADGTPAITSWTFTEDKTVVARWTANAYSISFDKNSEEATGTMEDLSMVYDVAKALTANSFIRTGYTFDKWTTKANGTGDAYTDAAEVINLVSEEGGSITLYAQWTPNDNTAYTVEYFYQDPVDGSYSETATASDTERTGTTATLVSVTDADKLAVETIVEGINEEKSSQCTYVFDENNTNNVLSASITRDGSMKLKVYLKAQYIVTIKPGTHAKDGETDQVFENLDFDAVIPSYDFEPAVGYHQTSYGYSKLVTKVKKTAEYTATWDTDKYGIEYILNGGLLPNGKTNPSTYDIETENITLKNPELAGSNFLGWRKNNETDADAKKTYVINKGTTGDITMVAVWNYIDYKLSFDLDGGAWPENYEVPTGYTRATEVSIPNPSRKGYAFMGWTGTGLEAAISNLVIPENSTGNRSYKATWAPAETTAKLNVFYEVNGKYTDEPKVMEFAANTDENITLNMESDVITRYMAETDPNCFYSIDETKVNVLSGKIADDGSSEFTVYIKQETYKINYDYKHGELADAAFDNPSFYARKSIDQTVTLNTVKRGRDAFDGWYVSIAGGAPTKLEGNSFTIPANTTGNISVVADWDAAVYKLVTDLDGGKVTGSMNRTRFTADDETFSLNNPVKEGYEFIGWIGDTLKRPTINVKIVSGTCTDLTFKATWKLAEASEETPDPVDTEDQSSYVDENGEKQYGTLEEILDELKDKEPATEDGMFEIHIQNDMTIDKVLEVPENTKLIIDKGVTVTIEENGSIEVPDSSVIINYGKIIGTGKDGHNDIEGNVYNEGQMDNTNVEGETTGDGETNFDMVTVHFVTGNDAVTIPDETIKKGRKVTKPARASYEDQIIEGWYTNEAKTNAYDFTLAVEVETTLYAKWVSNTTMEAKWTDTEGEDHYGTLEEALEADPNPASIIIQNDTEITKPLVIPEGTTVTVDEDVTLEISEDGSLDNTEGNDPIINNGTIKGDNEGDKPAINSPITNNGTITDVDIKGETTNNGTIKDSSIDGNVTNNEDAVINGSEIVGDLDNKGSATNTNVGGNVDNDENATFGSDNPKNPATVGGDINNEGTMSNTITDGTVTGNINNATRTVSFDLGAYGDPIESQEIVVGGRVEKPSRIIDDQAGLIVADWFVDAALSKKYDFDKVVTEDLILYAKWLCADDQETMWKDTAGNTNYGSLEEALAADPKPTEITIKNDTEITKSLVIPEGTSLTVDEGTTLKVSETGSLDNTEGNDPIINNGTIKGEGDKSAVNSPVTNNGNVDGIDVNGDVTNNGTMTGDDVNGDVTNNGTVTNSDVKGDLDNIGGNISNTSIVGDVTNNDNGTISDAVVSGNLDNSGTLKDSTVDGDLDNSGNVSGADVKGNVINGGTISDTDVDGDLTNNGTFKSTENNTSTVGGKTINGATGTIDDVTLGNVENNGSIDGCTVNGDLLNNGEAVDTDVNGNLDNSGTYKGSEGNESKVTGNITNQPTGELENTKVGDGDSTVINEGAIKNSDIKGDLINNGSVEGTDVSGDVDNLDSNATFNDNEGNAITYQFTFNMMNVGTQIAAQTIVRGNKATRPAYPKDADHTFVNWYTDENMDTLYDFDTAIQKDTVVYAKWLKNSEQETSYKAADGYMKYGSLETALSEGSGEVHIINDVTVKNDITVPDDIKLVVDKNSTLKVADNVKLDVDGTLVNNGKINNQGTVGGDGSITNNKTMSGGSIDVGVTNNGSISDTEINKPVTNNGIMSDNSFNAPVDNKGKVVNEGSNIGDLSTAVNVVNAPKTVIEGMDELMDYENLVDKDDLGITKDDQIKVLNGGSVNITLNATGIADVPSSEKGLISKAENSGKDIGMILDISIIKEVIDVNSNKVSSLLKETPNLLALKIALTEEQRSHKNLVVYRYHDGGVDEIPQGTTGEHCEFKDNGATLIIYARKFSTYVLGWDKPIVVPDTPVVVPDTTEAPKTTETTETTEAPQSQDPEISEKEKEIQAEIVKYTAPAKVETTTFKINEGLKVDQVGKNINVTWGKVSYADGYDIFVQYCGSKFTTKATKTIKKANTVTAKINKINSKALKLKKNFKVYVSAYRNIGGNKVVIGKSITAHIVGVKNTKFTNVKSITLKSSKSLTLKKGKTSKIKALTVLVDKKKKQLTDAHTTEFRYASTNKTVATVDKNGKITAKKKGSTVIWIYAKNGYAKKVKVTVK